MAKFGFYLLLLWSFWFGQGVGYAGVGHGKNTLHSGEQNTGKHERVQPEWTVVENMEVGERQGLQYQGEKQTMDTFISTAPASIFPIGTTSENSRLHNRRSVSAQGSSLAPGQIAGIVIAMVIISSFLSTVAVYLLLRRRRRGQEQEPFSKLEPDSRDHGLDSPPFENRLSSFPMYAVSITTGHGQEHQRAPTPSRDFVPGARHGLQPPPDAGHPAMSYTARPLSMPGPEGPDPFLPISPQSPQEAQALGCRRSKSDSSKRQPSSGSSGSGSCRGAMQGAAVEISLARKQSVTGGQRAQLVRVGSNRSRRSVRSAASGPDPLAMHPVYVYVDTKTQPQHIGMPLQSQAQPNEEGTPSPLSEQEPVPRQPVSPVSPEKDMPGLPGGLMSCPGLTMTQLS
ncbi:hypothetical protein GGR54DRAFT_30959 [Hypoxylon sp. NC1633]|nr:hypothetical protein GGR54DRAFT_30959 [Hypoxylon sp. NC1633]